MMDNGDDRQFSSGYTCPVALTNNLCLYSRVPFFTVDENTMTATLESVMPFKNYNYFGGNAELLANGDAHGDFCSIEDTNHPTSNGGAMVEYTTGSSPQLVWSLDVGGGTTADDIYRGQRWGSFYPGVTWTQ